MLAQASGTDVVSRSCILAAEAAKISGNLANDINVIRNLASSLSTRAHELEDDPTDIKLAKQVAKSIKRIEQAYDAGTPHISEEAACIIEELTQRGEA